MNLRTKQFLIGCVTLIMTLSILSACKTPAGRTSGAVVDDATITTKVKAKILNENQLQGFGISVNTFEGDVTLTGAVQSQAQKDQAEALAKSVEGVKQVNNLVEVRSSQASQGGAGGGTSTPPGSQNSGK